MRLLSVLIRYLKKVRRTFLIRKKIKKIEFNEDSINITCLKLTR